MKRVVVERLTLRVPGGNPAAARRLAVDVARRVAEAVRDVKTSQPRLRLNLPHKER